MTECINIIVYIAVIAGTSVGGIALFAASRRSHNSGVAVGVGRRDALTICQLIAAARAVGVARVAVFKFGSILCVADFSAAHMIALVHIARGIAAGRIRAGRGGRAGGRRIAVSMHGLYRASISAGVAGCVGIIIKLMCLRRRAACAAIALLPVHAAVIRPFPCMLMGCRDGFAVCQLIAAAEAVGIAGVAVLGFSRFLRIADFCSAHMVGFIYVARGFSAGGIRAGRRGCAGGGRIAVCMEIFYP